MPCQQCRDGRWECGPEGMLCGLADEPFEFQGIAYIPAGVGNLQVGVEVWAKCVERRDEEGNVTYHPIVHVCQHCPEVCEKKKKRRKHGHDDGDDCDD